MLSEVSGKEGYKFNLKAFLVHEAGPYFAGIKEEAGEECLTLQSAYKPVVL